MSRVSFLFQPYFFTFQGHFCTIFKERENIKNTEANWHISDSFLLRIAIQSIKWKLIQTSKVKFINYVMLLVQVSVLWVMMYALCGGVSATVLETCMKCLGGLSEHWRWNRLFGQDACWVMQTVWIVLAVWHQFWLMLVNNW